MKKFLAAAGRLFAALLIVTGVWLVVPGAAQAGNIYDSRVLELMTLSRAQRAKVRKVLKQSDKEMVVIFRKYNIDPDAKPVFDKLRAASTELQAVESREKRKMKKIMSRDQYKVYLEILQLTAARVIKATRNKP